MRSLYRPHPKNRLEVAPQARNEAFSIFPNSLSQLGGQLVVHFLITQRSPCFSFATVQSWDKKNAVLNIMLYHVKDER